MAAEPKTIQIDPDSELGRILNDAAERGTVLEQEGVGYRLVRIEDWNPMADSAQQRPDDQEIDDPLLGLIGILDGGEPSDIARFKDQYIADAIDRRGE